MGCWIRSLKGTAAQPLYVAKALGLPAVEADLNSDQCCGLSRDVVLAGNEMASDRCDVIFHTMASM